MWRQEIRPDCLILRMRHPGGPEHERIVGAIRLFGEKVLPHLWHSESEVGLQNRATEPRIQSAVLVRMEFSQVIAERGAQRAKYWSCSIESVECGLMRAVGLVWSGTLVQRPCMLYGLGETLGGLRREAIGSCPSKRLGRGSVSTRAPRGA